MKKILLFLSIVSQGNGWPISSLSLTRTNWTGTWIGSIENFPKSQTENNKTMVQWDIGNYPTSSNNCTTWKNIYSQNQTILLKKSYQFCLGADQQIIYIDESNQMKLIAQWFDDILIHPFTYDRFISINLIRMREDRLEEEKLTFENKSIDENIISMKTIAMQRLSMFRKRF